MGKDKSRHETPSQALEHLKKEAKRWLKSLREGDPEARARFEKAHPQAPERPVLRDVQLAVARERGAAGWAELKQAMEQSSPAPAREELVQWFLEQACPDWRTGGPAAQAAAQASAMRLLAQHPEIARASLLPAVVCGETEEVERILAEQPEAARMRGGPKQDWEPLHYLCFARLADERRSDHAAAVARVLLAHGADANAGFQIGVARHSPLVGVIGEGEERRAPHRRAQELVEVLLEGGANPCDTQVIYNVTQGDHPCRWIEILYGHSAKKGEQAEWTTPKHFREPKLSGFDWLLTHAVHNNDLSCARRLLERGANPKARAPWTKYPLALEARRKGFVEMAELLELHGAERGEAPLTDEEEFVAACLRMDRERVREKLAQHPEFLQSPAAIFAAAEQDRPDVVEFLLELGTPIEVENRQQQRPLHAAAGANAARVIRLLIDRGAEVDPVESEWGGTPLGLAVWGAQQEAIEVLSRYSREVFDLVFLGAKQRLREVLRERPELAMVKAENGFTPLMRLQHDDPEMVDLLIGHGADPRARLEDGRSGVEVLLRRGLEKAARQVAARASGPRAGS